MNVWADSLAKKELHRIATLPQCPPTPDTLQGKCWYAKVPSGKIMLDPHSPMINLLGQQEALHYLSHKQQLDAQSFDLVHWETLDKTIQSFPPTFQMWLSKFASGHSAVATMMFRWKCWDTAMCSLCQSLEETMAHVLLCPHTSCREIWAQQTTQLQQWLTQLEMAPDIQQCLLSTLTHQCNQYFQTSAPALCYPAAYNQDCIGFFGFMVGWLASKWIDIQGIHYSLTGSTWLAALWMVKLCHQIILMTHALWLSQNHQVNLFLRQWYLSWTIASICNQFWQGTTNLFPVNHFCYTRPPGLLSPTGAEPSSLMTNNCGSMQFLMHVLGKKGSR